MSLPDTFDLRFPEPFATLLDGLKWYSLGPVHMTILASLTQVVSQASPGLYGYVH